MLKPLSVVVAVAAAFGTSSAALAQDWPTRPITIVVPLAPGGSTDITARLIAEKLRGVLGQPIVIENKPGAGGNLGAAHASKAKPDGYTFLVTTSSLATNATLHKDKMPLDVRKDIEPVAQISTIPNVLMVNSANPNQTIEALIKRVSERKEMINYGSAGYGTSQHLSGALFNSMAKGEMVHVPYTGGAPANADLLGGQIQVVFSPLIEVLPFIDSGKLRALAVTTTERSARIPDVPAMTEVLPGYDIALWNGVFAPAGTPPAIIEKMNAAVIESLRDPGMKKALQDQGSIPVERTPADFKAFFNSEITKWGKLVELSGSKVE